LYKTLRGEPFLWTLGNTSLLIKKSTFINNALTVPYIKEISNGIKRAVGKNCDIRYTIPKKLNNIIKKGKDKLDNKMNTGVVYKLECNDCEKVYIGQTKRHLETRIKEHKNNIRNS